MHYTAQQLLCSLQKHVHNMALQHLRSLKSEAGARLVGPGHGTLQARCRQVR